MRPHHRLGAVLATLAVLSACGGGGGKKVPAPAPSPGPPPTVAGDVAPLTGLPQPDAGRRQRVALVVKIDNAPKGRPQSGLNQADVVVEEKVEDGVTRLFTVF